MPSRAGIGHRELSAAVILHEGIEAARMHLRLKHDAAVLDILGIYLDDTDMLAVDRRVEQEEPSAVLDKVAARLAVLYLDDLAPFSTVKVKHGQKSALIRILLTNEVEKLVADDVGRVSHFESLI